MTSTSRSSSSFKVCRMFSCSQPMFYYMLHILPTFQVSSEQAKYVLICFANQVDFYFAITEMKHEFCVCMIQKPEVILISNFKELTLMS